MNTGPLPGFFFEPQPWMAEAACKGQDPDMFVLNQGYTTAQARRFCIICPVTQQCETYGRTTKSVGVWGGKLFVLQSPEPIDLFPPYVELEDYRPVRLVSINPNKPKQPGILGMAAGFSRPGILGK